MRDDRKTVGRGLLITCLLFSATACGPPKRPAGSPGLRPGPVTTAPAGSPFALDEPPPPPAQPKSREITVVELANSLKREPTTVGFDIDDTVLFTTPAFYAGRAKYGEEYLRDARFWTDLNTDLDARFSTPKAIARLLLQLHLARGDRLVFISARPPGDDPDRAARATKDLLRSLFRLPDDIQVVFTNLKPKTQALRDTGVTLYYGDSDADVIDSLAAGTPVRPIRVLRGKYSNNTDTPHNGQLGEEVLMHSEE